jgi:hypothetical protein
MAVSVVIPFDTAAYEAKVAPRATWCCAWPSTGSLRPERSDILNVGGFSDAVFSVSFRQACMT